MLDLVYNQIEDAFSTEELKFIYELNEKYPDAESRFSALSKKLRSDDDLKETIIQYGGSEFEFLYESLEDFFLFVRIYYVSGGYFLPRLISISAKDRDEYRIVLESIIVFFESRLKSFDYSIFEKALGSVYSLSYREKRNENSVGSLIKKREENPKLCHAWQDLLEIYYKNIYSRRHAIEYRFESHNALMSFIEFWRLTTPAIIQEKIVEVFQNLNNDSDYKKFSLENIWLLTQYGEQELQGFRCDYSLFNNPGSWTYMMLEGS